MTVTQRDVLAVYLTFMGIKDPQRIKWCIDEYEEIRDILGLCCEERNGKEDDNSKTK